MCSCKHVLCYVVISQCSIAGGGDLHNAARKLSLQEIKHCLDDGDDVNAFDEHGNSPLLLAASEGNRHTVRLLLTAGADVRVTKASGASVLHASMNNTVDRVGVVSALLGAGAPIDKAGKRNIADIFNLALECSAEIEVFAMLLAAGYDLKGKVGKGYFQLLAAAGTARGDVVELLLKAGAPVQFDHPDGRTPVMFAARPGKRSLEALRLLIAAGAPVVGADATGATALHYAARDGTRLSGQAIRMLLDAGAGPDINAKTNLGATPLMEAAAYATHMEPIEYLIDAGADKNARDMLGNSPLNWVFRGVWLLPDPERVRALLLRDTLNVPNKHGWTPLMEAARHGSVDIVEFLLERGGDPNVTNDEGWNSLMIAAAATYENPRVWSHWFKRESAKHLELTHQKLDDYSYVVYRHAGRARVGKVWSLLAHGADPNVKGSNGETVHTILNDLV